MTLQRKDARCEATGSTTGRPAVPGLTAPTASQTAATEPSQCDRVLEVLADGLEHSISEIHERAGTMRLNSRVAELRKRGHVIVCTRAGADYAYQLVSSPRADAAGAAASASASEGESLRSPESTPRPGGSSGERSDEQLAFEVAA